MTPPWPLTTSESVASGEMLGGKDETGGADSDAPSLVPECRLVSGFLWVEHIGVKAASDTPTIAHSNTSESLAVEDNTATIPVTLWSLAAGSPPSDRRPLPPSRICINGKCTPP